MKRIPALLALVLTISMLLAACGGNPGASSEVTPAPLAGSVVAEGHLVPRSGLYLTFPARGRVEAIPVQKGEAVTKGQVLVRLGDRQPVEAALASARLQLVAAQQEYDALVRTSDAGRARAWQAFMDAQKARSTAQLAWDQLNLGTIQTDIDNAQSDVTSRKTDLDDAQKDFDKYKDLPSDNSSRKSYEDKLRTAQTNYDQAVQKRDDLVNNRDRVRAALDAALGAEAETRRTYENTRDGPDSDKLALTQAKLDAAAAQADAAQAALDNYELKAPFAGVVADVNTSVGEWSGPETWAVAVADTRGWYVDTSDLSELDVVKIKVGQPADATADALPGVSMTGVVESISEAPKVQGGDVLYTVRIRMADVDPRLRWGMTVEVTFTEAQQ